MAVANPQAMSLTPAFGNIQEALGQRARLALQEPGSAGTLAAASGAVKDIAVERRQINQAKSIAVFKASLQEEVNQRQRDFTGRFDFEITPEITEDLADEFGIPISDLSSFVGVKFKNRKDAIDATVKSIMRTLEFEKAELEGRQPGASEVPTPGPVQDLAGGAERIPAGRVIEQPVILPGGEKAVQAAGIPTQTNAQRIEELEKRISVLKSASDEPLKGTAAVRNLVPTRYFDEENKVWRKGTWIRTEQRLVRGPDDPIVEGPRKFIKDPATEELIEDLPDLTKRPVTGPEPVRRGELKTDIKQLTAKQKRLLPGLETRLEKGDTFKSARNLKLTLGDFKTVLNQDLATVSGALRSKAARALAGEKGVLTEQDVQRVSGSPEILEQWKQGIRFAADGTLTEKSWQEFQQVLNTLLIRAEILEDSAVTDITNDATGPLGEFKDVEPSIIRERLGAPEATGFVDREISSFKVDDVKNAMDNMNRLGTSIDMESLRKTLLFMERKGKIERAKK